MDVKGELTAGPPSGLQPPDSEMKHRIQRDGFDNSR